MLAREIDHNFPVVCSSALFIGGIGTWHATRRADGLRKGSVRRKFMVFALLIGIVYAASNQRDAFAAFAAVVTCAGLWEICHSRLAGRLTTALAILCYLLLCTGFLIFSWAMPQSTILLVFGIACCMDGFSQVSGQLLGRHSLAPRISPGKTLEGLLGGLLATLAFTSCMVNLHPPRDFLLKVSLIASAGVCGDLLASSYKRAAGIKDFSALIPYHGGILDRFDSLIVAACTCYTVVKLGVRFP